MTKIYLILLFTVFTLNIFGQTEQTPAVKNPVGVQEIYLARDDGNGEAGKAADIFQINDVPIYCVIQLDSTTPAIVKMNLVAVSVKGVKPETKVVSVSYKTNGKQDRVNFTGKPESLWTAGNYRVDVFLDGKLAQSKTFEIESSAAIPAVVNSFQPKTTPAKPKSAKRPRKN